MKIINNIISYWKRDKILFCLEGSGYAILLVCNIWLITRPLPPAEVAFWWLIANLIGFFIGSSVVKPVLLGTIFKKKFEKMIENIIKLAKNG